MTTLLLDTYLEATNMGADQEELADYVMNHSKWLAYVEQVNNKGPAAYDATRAATDAAIRDATDDATRAVTDPAAYAATDAATDPAAYDAIRAATDAAIRDATDAADSEDQDKPCISWLDAQDFHPDDLISEACNALGWEGEPQTGGFMLNFYESEK